MLGCLTPLKSTDPTVTEVIHEDSGIEARNLLNMLKPHNLSTVSYSTFIDFGIRGIMERMIIPMDFFAITFQKVMFFQGTAMNIYRAK